VIDSALQKVSETDSGEMTFRSDESRSLPKTHIIYAGNCYAFDYDSLFVGRFHPYSFLDSLKTFESIILTGIKKCNIESAMVTKIVMYRQSIITKEAMEKYCKGEILDLIQMRQNDSVNDDLESFFEDLRLGKRPEELVGTYYLPKLTKKQMQLVESKDPSYFKTFFESNPDVDEAEMRLSESKSKFVRAFAQRRTFTLPNPSHRSKPLHPVSTNTSG